MESSVFLAMAVSFGFTTLATPVGGAEGASVIRSHAVFGTRLVSITPPYPTTGGVINADGSRILLASKLGTELTLWDGRNANLVAHYHHDGTPTSRSNTVFSPDGKLAYIPSLAVTMHSVPTEQNLLPAIDVLDAETGNYVKSFNGPVWSKPCQNSAQGIAISDNGKYLAATLCFNKIALYDTTTWSLLSIQESTHVQAERLAVSPSGRLLALGYPSGIIEVRDAVSGAVKVKLSGHNDNYDNASITGLSFSQDGRTLYSSAAQTILGDSRRLADFTQGRDQKSIAADNMNPRAWDSSNGQRLRTYNYGRVTHESTLMTLSPDGRMIVAAKGFSPNGYPATYSLVAFDTETQRVLDQVDVSPETIVALSFSKDGRVLCVVGARLTYTVSVRSQE